MLNEFNADATTVDVPKLTIDGRVHTGRVLSIDEWFAFAERYDALRVRAEKEKAAAASDGRALVADIHALRLEFLRAVFPVRRPWRNWFRKIDPIAAVVDRGARALGDAFDSFFEHQTFALGMVPRTPTEPPKTDGTNSPASTTAAPNVSAPNAPSA